MVAAEVEEMLSSLFGSEANLHAVAAAWKRSNFSGAAGALRQHPFSQMAGVRNEVASLWVRLTRIMHAAHQLPLGERPVDGYLHRATIERMLFLPGCVGWHRGATCLPDRMGPRHSIQREVLHRWHVSKARELAPNLRCIETGDGHFLHMMRSCSVRWSADLYARDVGYKLDLEALPSAAPPEVRAAHGTFDVAVSHQVFEHLGKPTVGIANVNALLKVALGRDSHTLCPGGCQPTP